MHKVYEALIRALKMCIKHQATTKSDYKQLSWLSNVLHTLSLSASAPYSFSRSLLILFLNLIQVKRVPAVSRRVHSRLMCVPVKCTLLSLPWCTSYTHTDIYTCYTSTPSVSASLLLYVYHSIKASQTFSTFNKSILNAIWCTIYYYLTSY